MHPDTARAAVELHDLTKTFPVPGGETVRAVDGIDLTVRTGEVVAFLGPNGAGKTTTLDMVLGLTRPTSGAVRTVGLAPRQAVAAGRVSAVLQTGGLLADLTVRETVQMIASTYARHAPVDEVLERTGLTALARRRVSLTSGGEQQRLRFALALLPDPDLLVLDEPTAGMDVSARHEFWATMHAEARAGRTIVFATHYLEEADAFARRIVMIAAGRLVADGTTEQIRARASGRTVSADLPEGAVAATLAHLHALPSVVDVTARDNRVSVVAGDSDAIARALLDGLGGRNLEITAGSLESAFLSITTRAREAVR
ncbi:ABC transporter ATP-binding protein [Ornithinimicrobium humiphilum]|uniref:ABC-2 type transport system ATP-binding protein n=1 Tax=Ornithinimicrobium humiphilum TaxID=125288 RepID=A0A543KL13_9MICO|nr:ABC transporter ATP-binding protein [Ornithinimicrobium humiphilum]TQM95768.1 ABC-2 type transport system ATP-binding protein [Ornithinimicrobium humiphilum]